MKRNKSARSSCTIGQLRYARWPVRKELFFFSPFNSDAPYTIFFFFFSFAIQSMQDETKCFAPQ